MAKAKKPTKSQLDAEIEQKLEIVIAGLEKQYGKGIVGTLNSNTTWERFSRQIPSGSLGLDIALGPIFRLPSGAWQTGYAGGRIIEIFGPEGGGKTTLCLLLIANAQKLGIPCAFIDMEHALDPEYAKSLGVDLSKLLVSQPSNGEECLNIMETLVKSGVYGVIVGDSVAAMISKSELDGEIGDATMGSQARLMSQAMRKISSALGPNNPVCVVFTNQIRMKIGVMFGNPETTTGGNALKFYAGYRIDIRPIQQLKDGEKIYGRRTRVKVIKNKVSAPFREAEFDLVFGKGVDYYAELLDMCVQRCMIQQSGAWFNMGAIRLGQGRAMALDHLRNNREMCYSLYNQLLTAIMAERGYTPEGVPIPGAVPEGLPSSQAAAFLPLTTEETAALAEQAALETQFGGNDVQGA